jgi:nucleoside-diphosphate-sugar epimerase
VTGGSGAMGSVLVKALIDKGNTVRVLALPGDPGAGRLAALGVEVRPGNVADAADVAGAAEGCDTVYHLAAVIIAWDDRVYERVNVGGTANVVAESRRAGVGHLVHVSSASVVYPRSTPYSRSKQQAERLVRGEPRFAFTIVRPTLVYDEHGGQEFRMFWAQLRRFPIVPFVGRGEALKSPVHTDDLVSGLLAIAGNPRAYGKIYNLCGGEEVTLAELARLLLSRDGQEKRFLHLPVPLCRLIAWGLPRVWKGCPLTQSAVAGLTQDANLDLRSAKEDLGYSPIGVRAGLASCFPLANAERSS